MVLQTARRFTRVKRRFLSSRFLDGDFPERRVLSAGTGGAHSSASVL